MYDAGVSGYDHPGEVWIEGTGNLGNREDAASHLACLAFKLGLQT